MEFQMVPSLRSDGQLLFAGDHLYRKRKMAGPKVRYDCFKTTCPAKLVAEATTCYVPAGSRNHNHGSQVAMKDELEFKHRVRTACENSSRSTREIFEEERARDLRGAALVGFDAISRQMARKKNAHFPAAPLTVQGVADAFQMQSVIAQYGKSLANEENVFYNCTVIEDTFKYTIFSAGTMLERLTTMPIVRSYHIDATFRVVPNGEYKQLLIIHISYKEHAFPLFYILMTRKTEIAYTHLFKKIDETIFKLEPVTVMSDYERAMRNAIRTVFPDCRLNGCWFHYCQALRRKIMTIEGFHAKINADDGAKKLFHKFLAIPLVRIDLIEAATAHLVAESLAFGQEYAAFVDYFERQWLQIETAQSICVFLQTARTNNLVESHNSSLAKKMPPNGNFFKFVEELRKQDFQKDIDFVQLASGNARVFSPIRKKLEKRNANIRKSQLKMNAGQLSVQEFLDEVAYPNNNAVTDMADPINVVSEDELEDGPDLVINATNDAPNYIQLQNQITVLQQQLTEQRRTNNQTLCVICLERVRKCCLLPCRHLALCEACCNRLIQDELGNFLCRCPICREIVTEFQIQYW